MLFSKKFFFLLFFCTLLASNLPSLERLILHFDVNKTLIASDKAGTKTIDNVINELLAEKYQNFWEKDQKKPLTYYDYVYTIVVPGDPKDPELKKIRNGYLHNFVHFLEKSNHPLKNTVQQKYQELSLTLEKKSNPIFSSFFSLIKYLDEQKIPYSIILRSFGKEIKVVAKEIEKELKRPLFDSVLTFQKRKLQWGDKVLSNGREIAQLFTSGKNFIVQDDYVFWHAHKELQSFGKPFYLNLKNPKVIQIFFDDNIEDFSSPTNVIAPFDSDSEKPLPFKDLIDKGLVVKVDTIDAILDENYFIHKVQTALEKAQKHQFSCSSTCKACSK
jgi:hypothetical protein